MSRSLKFRKHGFLPLAIFFLLLIIPIGPIGTRAADGVVQETMTAQKLNLISGKSTILKSTQPVKRVSIANPEIADFMLLSPHEIYLTGKTAGTTNLTLRFCR